MYRILLWIVNLLNDTNKANMANVLLTDIHISNKVAEEMIIKIVKSSGNKITDFIVKG